MLDIFQLYKIPEDEKGLIYVKALIKKDIREKLDGKAKDVQEYLDFLV